MGYCYFQNGGRGGTQTQKNRDGKTGREGGRVQGVVTA